MTDLSGQTALVTGASKGIGAATARALAAAGAHVILTARDSRALETVEDAIHAAGGAATIAPLDLAEPDAIARLADAVAARWAALDVLVHSAAMLPTLMAVAELDQPSLARAITLNAMATQALIARFDPLLRRSKDARLVYLTTSVATAPRAYWGAYAATKAAGEVFALTYAEETKNLGKVRVAVVNPGATRTAMRAKAYPGEDPASVKPPEAVAEALLALLGERWESPHRVSVNLS